ncbi:MAG: hypothetical protein LBV33_05070 [Lachnospiraceae bacterium]|jgi:hypothetical protein|nr:hypothetical protein [Lachnospiraceae bacterium]
MNSRVAKIFRRIALLFVACFVGLIIYSAIPFNGALSWKIDDLLNKRTVTFNHNNIFEDGAGGLLTDLDQALNLPEELYISNQYRISFDEEGMVRDAYLFIYGRDEKGETRTYLADYNAALSNKITVFLDGAANTSYEQAMVLEPMLTLLEQADFRQQVDRWAESHEGLVYELVYYGQRSFNSPEGLVLLPGDVDGDGIETGTLDMGKLNYGGEIRGFEVSLHIPAVEGEIPIRYIMEPQYITPETLNDIRETEQLQVAKEAGSFTIDQDDGTMYFFLDDWRGWRLVIADAAAGSRFYIMEETSDGGDSWMMLNDDPFMGNIGVTEGLVFYDEQLGFAGLTGASYTYSQIYRTVDGGITFTPVNLPMETVSELPASAVEYGYTIDNYGYMTMPIVEGDSLVIYALSQSEEGDGIVFKSADDGASWTYFGVSLKNL